LITELCEAGELAKFIKKVGPIPEPQSRTIMRQIVDAISYLHKHGKILDLLNKNRFNHFNFIC
jgi:serine/threonine protein kinase